MINIESETLMVNATDMVEYLFCPRFTYYEYTLRIPEHQHTRGKVRRGRAVHEQKRSRNKDYLRKKLGCVEREFHVYLSSAKHHMKGIVDEVLLLEGGERAALDYKYTIYEGKVRPTHRMQIVFYSRLVSICYNCPVHWGFLVYVRSKNRVTPISIRNGDYRRIDRLIKEMIRIIRDGYFPPPTPHRGKCVDCCYRNICPEGIL